MIFLSVSTLVFEDLLLNTISFSLILLPNMILSLILFWMLYFQNVFFSSYVEITMIINISIVLCSLYTSFFINLITEVSDFVFLILSILIIMILSLTAILQKIGR